MEPFRTFAALSITATAADLAHSALPDAPVRPYVPTTRAYRRLVDRAVTVLRRRDRRCELEACRPAYSPGGSTP